ncbi:probable U3 small nucleolar RNA-associated protein 7 [Xenia sp. Carnegie-2017]|uniref:probable U3 small nucleolar RNA-associated protein 7 n=1 Tax=Xenia sp. Carnegie-2017 TaxID=2897299 RepID=UPI001F0410A0|nr:probable U3 small nucleolar RNA-associated protein 7 [Xenia sp. Carnegie-2017]
MAEDDTSNSDLIDDDALKKYLRGSKLKIKHVKNKKLRRSLSKNDTNCGEAALQAFRSELLLLEEPGYLEAEGCEKTYHFKQSDIVKTVDISTANKHFELNLETFAPYNINYTRDGRYLLLGGQKGHLTAFDWKNKKLKCEFHVQETVRDVRWLHVETMFAVAQKKNVFIYDNTGLELHCLKDHEYVNRLDFLPYHFLLTTIDQKGFLKYQDVSTGKLVSKIRTKLGPCDCMAQNFYNAIVHLGHCRGTVTFWSPNMKEPLVKMLCHRGPVKAIAIDQGGWYLATSGLDAQIKVWDIRTYKQLQAYRTVRPASTLAISQRGLLATGCGPHVQIWKDAFRVKQKTPYMTSLFGGETVRDVEFCPFEDVLGVGHSRGFTSLLIPGAGEPNFDALESNPYHNKKQRQEFEVKALLDKIQPDLISLNPSKINEMDVDKNIIMDDTNENKPEDSFVPKHKTKGRSSSAKQFKRKKRVLSEDKRDKVKELIREKKAKKNETYKETKDKHINKKNHVLDRFRKTTTT